MDKEALGKLLVQSLNKYNFKNYASKLFYMELNDSIVILEQTYHNGAAEMYLNIIIKECHPELSKITKGILKDNLLLDTTGGKLFFKTKNGYQWNFLNISVDEFESTIDDFYNENIKPFEISYLNGIKHYNELYYEIFYGNQIELYKDIAEKIGHPELAHFRGHEWFLSDYYYLVFKCNIDSRFVCSNTEKYIIENVIKKSPEGLKGKELTKWRNERCKEMLIAKRMWRSFGYGIPFPFIDEKPLKFYGTDIENGKAISIFINEETGEFYHCRITDRSDPNDVKYEVYKVK